jgi:hypothetical protein
MGSPRRGTRCDDFIAIRATRARLGRRLEQVVTMRETRSEEERLELRDERRFEVALGVLVLQVEELEEAPTAALKGGP